MHTILDSLWSNQAAKKQIVFTNLMQLHFERCRDLAYRSHKDQPHKPARADASTTKQPHISVRTVYHYFKSGMQDLKAKTRIGRGNGDPLPLQTLPPPHLPTSSLTIHTYDPRILKKHIHTHIHIYTSKQAAHMALGGGGEGAATLLSGSLHLKGRLTPIFQNAPPLNTPPSLEEIDGSAISRHKAISAIFYSNSGEAPSHFQQSSGTVLNLVEIKIHFEAMGVSPADSHLT